MGVVVRFFLKYKLFLGGILFILLSSISGYFVYQNYLERLAKEKIIEIKSHYGDWVKVFSQAKLYEKQENDFAEIGEVHEDVVLALAPMDIQSEFDTKFLIQDTNYYVDYAQVEVVEQHFEGEQNGHYLALEKDLVTREKTNLYQDNMLKIELYDSATFPILYGTESFYRIMYMGNFFDIKKEEVEVKASNLDSSIKDATYISTVQFAKYDENCSSNTCISKAKVTELLKEWQEKEIYSITEAEYLAWLNGDLRLKPGAMLITFDTENEFLQSMLHEQGYDVVNATQLTFVNNDSTTRKDTKKESVNRYVLHHNFTKEQNQKMLAGETILKPKVNTTSTRGLPSMDAKATSIAVLNYHFFYDASIGEVCREGNCLEVKKFREQLDYLKENHYKTLTMEEYRAWMYHEIELPARSVLLTIDDGAMGTGKHNGNKLIPILEEYQMHATLFLITGWWDINNYRSPYLDIESHTYDMHTEGLCKNQTRGAKMLCSTKEQVLDDLRKSLSVTGSNKAFCFPFYAYNDMAIQSLKEVGFQLGFVGGYAKSNRNQDKYKITRYPIHSNTSLNQFMNMIH